MPVAPPLRNGLAMLLAAAVAGEGDGAADACWLLLSACAGGGAMGPKREAKPMRELGVRG